jgi:anti-sigma B factor antagonist
MHIGERIVDGVTILDLEGKLVLGEGDRLLRDKVNALVREGRTRLLLNLAGVTYVDSAGLGEIVRSHATVVRQGGALKLLRPDKRLRDLLTITKLVTVFEIFVDEQEAVRSFSRG